jgi:small subunit ribosomal protein S15
MTKEEMTQVIEQYRKHPKDTASAAVQIAILTKRLQSLNEHFKVHKKDNHSRNGLIKLVGQRKRFLTYLQKNNFTEYKETVQKLGLRK